MQLQFCDAVRSVTATFASSLLCLSLTTPANAAGQPPEEAFQSVHVFTNSRSPASGGASPDGQMIQASDGLFYGVSRAGGKFGLGALYRMTPDGTTTTLVSFNATTGTAPRGPLTLGRDGNLYGVTSAGGNCDICGTAFRLSKKGKFKILHRFSGTEDGAAPNGGLVQTADGNFYGTTHDGGEWRAGGIFRMTPDGTVTREASFYGLLGAYFPRAGMVLASDGALYGTGAGGEGGWGAVYRFEPGVGVTWGASLDRYTGASPASRLVQGADGYLYGTASSYGPNTGGLTGNGTIFRFLPFGRIEVFVAFDGTSGKKPIAGLTLGADGNFYGAAYEGGDSNMGTLFRVTPSRQLSVMHTFRGGGDGGHPLDPPVQGQDGWLMGTTSTGGSGDNVGTAYKAAP